MRTFRGVVGVRGGSPWDSWETSVDFSFFKLFFGWRLGATEPALFTVFTGISLRRLSVARC